MKAETPLVTILMPVYNGEAYLKEAIDSILAQTFDDFQLLIINDGSTDNTQNILESYTDSRIKIHQQQNKGVSRSLNAGLAMIDTAYIRRHDADDVSEPTMLQKQIDFLQQHSEISFVSTMCAFMTDNSKVAYDYTQPKKGYFEGDAYRLVKLNDFNPYSPIVHGTVLGPTKIFKEFNGYRTEFLTSEDNDLWLRIIEKYKFAVMNISPYYLRLSSNSATKMHGATTTFYRDKSYEFALDRRNTGSDLLQRGEMMPKPELSDFETVNLCGNGQDFRKDLLNFNYHVYLNAKDYRNVFNTIRFSLRDGWGLSKTWKTILFPLLGNSVVKAGSKIKSAFR